MCSASVLGKPFDEIEKDWLYCTSSEFLQDRKGLIVKYFKRVAQLSAYKEELKHFQNILPKLLAFSSKPEVHTRSSIRSFQILPALKLRNPSL